MVKMLHFSEREKKQVPAKMFQKEALFDRLH